MRYQGGKSRIAKPISEAIINEVSRWEIKDSKSISNCNRKMGESNQTFISEQTAPDDFECIWEKPFTRTLDRNKDNQFKVVEKLFTYKK